MVQITKRQLLLVVAVTTTGLGLCACSLCQTGGDVSWFAGKDVALERAIDNDDVAALGIAIRQGANVNARGRVGVTPLEYAIGHSKKSTFAALLRDKADPN